MYFAYTNNTFRPWLKTVVASAAKIARGANAMTYRVTRKMTVAISSMVSMSFLTLGPRLEAAAPKKTENTTICNISLLAIAWTMEVGMTWSRKSLNCNVAGTAVPAAAEAGERPRPGLNSCTATSPIVIETSVATTNQPSALAPILAIAAAPSMRATPTTSVENTNGAMIILM